MSRTSMPPTAISSATGLPDIKASPRRSQCWKTWPTVISAATRCFTRRERLWAILTLWSALRIICAYSSRRTPKIPCRLPRPEPLNGCFRVRSRRPCPQASSVCRSGTTGSCRRANTVISTALTITHVQPSRALPTVFGKTVRAMISAGRSIPTVFHRSQKSWKSF